jgi:hypothetical protein
MAAVRRLDYCYLNYLQISVLVTLASTGHSCTRLLIVHPQRVNAPPQRMWHDRALYRHLTCSYRQSAAKNGSLNLRETP